VTEPGAAEVRTLAAYVRVAGPVVHVQVQACLGAAGEVFDHADDLAHVASA
jgi:hypothetical protein